MNFLKNKSIFYINLVAITIIIGLLFISVNLTMILFHYKEYKNTLNKTEEDFFYSQKEMIRNQVENFIYYIKFRNDILEEEMRINTKNITENFYGELLKLINNNKISFEKVFTNEKLKNSLLKFELKNNESIYIIDEKGNIIFSINNILNKDGNIYDERDINGKYYIKELIEFFKKGKDGFITYKINYRNDILKSIAYVKASSEIPFIIFTTNFYPERQNLLKQNILEKIENLKQINDSYFFIVNYNGRIIINGIDSTLNGKTLNDLKDNYVNNLIKEFLKAKEKTDGVFIKYYWPKPSTGKIEAKISYAKRYEDWQWIIGTGIYVGQLENYRLSLKAEFYRIIKKRMYHYSIVFLILSIIAIYGYYFISKKMQKEFDFLVEYFQNSALFCENIKKEKFSILEFQKLSEYINIMIKKIHEKNEAYENVNNFLEEKLIEVNEIRAKLEKLMQLIDKYIILSETDENGFITYVSTAFCNISGYTREELLGRTYRMVEHPDMEEKFLNEIKEVIYKKGKTWQGEIKYLNKNGQEYWEFVNITPMFDEKDKIIGCTCVGQDITDKKKIEELMIIDDLTQIYNRNKFNSSLQYEIDKAKRYNTPLSLIMFDIDFFKSINDTYGHQVGDTVLKETAFLVKKNIRKADILARWGGEEFMIIAPNTNYEQAIEFAEKIRLIIEGYKFSNVDRIITCSFGVTTYHDTYSFDDMIRKVDNALYLSKRNGRNLVSSFE